MNNETVEANSPKMETVFDDKNLLNINKYLGESGFGRFEKTGFVTKLNNIEFQFNFNL